VSDRKRSEEGALSTSRLKSRKKNRNKGQTRSDRIGPGGTNREKGNKNYPWVKVGEVRRRRGAPYGKERTGSRASALGGTAENKMQGKDQEKGMKGDITRTEGGVFKGRPGETAIGITNGLDCANLRAKERKKNGKHSKSGPAKSIAGVISQKNARREKKTPRKRPKKWNEACKGEGEKNAPQEKARERSGDKGKNATQE